MWHSLCMDLRGGYWSVLLSNWLFFFFWSNHHEPLPKTWREDDAAVSRLLSLAVGARGVRHVRHDGKLEIKRAMTFVLHPFGTVYAITLSLEI